MAGKGLQIFFLLVVSIFAAITAPAVQPGKTVTWEGGGEGRVIFEGDEHAGEGYKCGACHPSLFRMKSGEAQMTMGSLNKGQFCGACHNGKITFSTDDPHECRECHKKKKGRHREKNHHDDDDDDD